MSSTEKYCCSRISQKWIFTLMGFFAVFCAFAMRMCLPLTIPRLVKPIEHTQEFHDDSCPNPDSNLNFTKLLQNKTIDNADYFDWSEHTQGIILGSFFWGYIISHVPGGILAERFGGKHVLGLGILTTALFTIFTPAAVNWGGSTALIFLRILMGMCEGTTQPAISVMMAQWIPADERSRTTSYVYMGATFGVLVISIGLGPVIRLMDWTGVYYLFGGIGVLWYAIWIVLCYNSPSEHPFISEKEAKDLKEKLSQHTHADPPPVPWKHLLRSPPFWALVIVSVGRDWGGYTMMSDMPKYTMNVLRFSMEENGLLFLVLNVSIFVSCIVSSWLSDWLIQKEILSRTNTRKVLGTVSMSFHSIFSVWASYVGCNKLQYFIITSIGAALVGAGFPSIKANVLDLSPNYAGTVMAISHGLAAFCGIGGPYVVALLAPNQTLSEWRIVFWVIFAVTVATNIVYILFASGEVQDWNDPNFDRKTKKLDSEVKESEKLLTLEKVIIVNAQDLN